MEKGGRLEVDRVKRWMEWKRECGGIGWRGREMKEGMWKGYKRGIEG